MVKDEILDLKAMDENIMTSVKKCNLKIESAYK